MALSDSLCLPWKAYSFDFWLWLPFHPGPSCRPLPTSPALWISSQILRYSRSQGPRMVNIHDSKVKPHDLPPPRHTGPTRIDMRQPAMRPLLRVSSGESGRSPWCLPHSPDTQSEHIWLLCSSLALSCPQSRSLKRNGFPPCFLGNTPSLYHGVVRLPLWSLFSTLGENYHPGLVSSGWGMKMNERI